MSTCSTCNGTGKAWFERNGISYAEDCADCEEGMRVIEAKRMRKALEDQRAEKKRKELLAAGGRDLVARSYDEDQGKLFGAGKD